MTYLYFASSTLSDPMYPLYCIAQAVTCPSTPVDIGHITDERMDYDWPTNLRIAMETTLLGNIGVRQVRNGIR